MTNRNGSGRSIPKLIDALGGPAAIGRRLALPPSTVSDMKARGIINMWHWPGIIVLAREAGMAWVDADALLRLNLRLKGPYRLSCSVK